MSKIVYSKSKTCTSKKLTQTRISTYFTGCIKTLPLDLKMSKNKTNSKSRSRKRLSFSSSANTSQSESFNLMQDLVSSVPKRKLPVPILSDDEDSDDFSPSPSKRRAGNNDALNRPEATIKLNKSRLSDSANTPKKTSVKSSPVTSAKKSPVSSSSGLLNTSNNVNTQKSPKKIELLENIVIKTPKKTPQKDLVKDEKKKINYEQLKVIQEFFLKIAKTSNYMNLVNSNDKEMLKKFFQMDKEYKFVCVKLFMWKHIWYNIFKFVENIGLTMGDSEIVAMYNTLKENNFVETDYSAEDVFTLLNLLSLKDIRDIAKTFKFGNVSGTKEVLITKLMKMSQTQYSLSSLMSTEEVLKKKVKEKMGYCIKMSKSIQQCIYYVYVLNTFTNPKLLDPQDYFKDVSFMRAVFPPYNVENFCIFYTPLEFARFADSMKLRSDLRKAIEKKYVHDVFEICKGAYDMLKQVNEEMGNSFDSLRQPHLERFTANAQYVSILSSGAKHIKTKFYENACIWYEYLLSQGYCKHKRGEWYDNLVLIYAQYLKNYEKAATLIIKAFKEDKDYFSEIQWQELAHRGKMLNKKTYNLPTLFHDEIAALSPKSCERDWPQDVFYGKSMICDDPRRRRVYAHRCENGDVKYLTVEQTALLHYKSVGYPNGEHCEGSLINASFCLLFWDIIYEKYVKGTFVSSLQSMPLDMYSEYFYKNREKTIKRRLNDIGQNWSDEVLKEKIFVTWDLHSHETALCSLESTVSGPGCLFDVICCIGRSVLTKIFERLVKNYKLYHSGFPDLIVWNTQEKKAKFVEVKSDNDKLSFKQKLWLNYLMDVGATVAVCHVESKGSKKKFVKSKSSTSKS